MITNNHWITLVKNWYWLLNDENEVDTEYIKMMTKDDDQKKNTIRVSKLLILEDER